VSTPELSGVPGAELVRRLTEPRTIGIVGVVAGLVAFWLALPPWTLRDLAGPIAAGFIALACGLAVVTRGEKKLGWWAIGLGLAGTLGAVWLQTKDAETLNSVLTAGVLASTLRFATPLAFAAMGGLVSERSGVVNIGLEGMMLMGAFFGLWGAEVSGSWVVGILVAMLSGAVLAFVHAAFSIHLRADQIVSGFAVNFMALGLTGYLFSSIYPEGIPSDVDRVPNVDLGFLSGIPVVGDFLADLFGDLNLLIWIMLGTVFLVWLVLFRTPIGLRVRSVGEHPRAADTVGISVYGIRYGAVVTSGVLAALGGAFLSIGFVGTFAENMTSGRGFIALAAMIFGKWLPWPAFAATLLFGFGFALSIPLQREAGVSENIISILPYVLTLIALVGLIGRSIPPAADGKPYIK
jgi:simple sugar transport system permease protein